LNNQPEHIIQGCLQNDRKYQEILYKEYYPVMIRICQRYTNDLDEAGAVYNEAMFKVFQKIGQFNHEGPFEGWVKRVVVNTCIDHCRRFTHQPVDDVQDKVATVQPHAYSRLGANEIMALIRELPKNTSLVFNLYVLEGYKHHEIAEILGISTGTSKWHLNEARKILKSKIESLSNLQFYLHAI
jgi:RNA polymerase sigma-70 factor, ECF subfamily